MPYVTRALCMYYVCCSVSQEEEGPVDEVLDVLADVDYSDNLYEEVQELDEEIGHQQQPVSSAASQSFSSSHHHQVDYSSQQQEQEVEDEVRLWWYIVSRDFAWTRPACLLDRQFPENLLFGQAKFSMKNEFSILTLWG